MCGTLFPSLGKDDKRPFANNQIMPFELTTQEIRRNKMENVLGKNEKRFALLLETLSANSIS
jgi:hypothetical protein